MTLIDKAEALAILAPAPNSKGGLWATRKQALYEQVAALPAVTPTQAREAAIRECASALRKVIDYAAFAGADPDEVDDEAINSYADYLLTLIGETRA